MYATNDTDKTKLCQHQANPKNKNPHTLAHHRSSTRESHSTDFHRDRHGDSVLQCVAACCSLLQCVVGTSRTQQTSIETATETDSEKVTESDKEKDTHTVVE